MTLDTEQLFARFEIEHFDRNSISDKRRTESLTTLRRLAARLDYPLSGMTASDLMAWQASELERTTPNTLRNRESMVRSFIRWEHAAGVISFERWTQLKEVSQVRGALTPPKPKPYKKHELQHFRELLDRKFPLVPTAGRGSQALTDFFAGRAPYRKRVYRHARRLQFEAQVALALELGLRCEEIHNVTMVELHWENASVLVRTVKSKPGEKREREVPYTAHARTCVREWLEFRALLAPGHDAPWLLLRHEAPVRPQSYRHFEESLTRSGIGGGYNWHRFRHTFATARLRRGMPLEKLQVMLGHSNISQTLAYAEIVNADVSVEALRTESDFMDELGLAA